MVLLIFYEFDILVYNVSMKNKFLGNLALLITALIWGLSFVAQREGMEHIGPFTFNAVRSILGGFSLLPVIAWIKLSQSDCRTQRIKRYQHINLARAGIGCGLALFTAMSIQQYCMQYVTAGKSGFITALYIIFVPIISILLGEKLRKKIILSIMFAVIGLYLLCYKPGNGFNIYDVLLLVGAFFYGVHIMVVNYYSEKINPAKACCLQFFVVGILSALLMWGFENPTITAILSAKSSLLFAGVLTCGVAYTLQIFGQKYTLPVVASLILCLESVFAVIGGTLILHETMLLKEIIGCIFMITAVVIANLKFRECD